MEHPQWKLCGYRRHDLFKRDVLKVVSFIQKEIKERIGYAVKASTSPVYSPSKHTSLQGCLLFLKSLGNMCSASDFVHSKALVRELREVPMEVRIFTISRYFRSLRVLFKSFATLSKDLQRKILSYLFL